MKEAQGNQVGKRLGQLMLGSLCYQPPKGGTLAQELNSYCDSSGRYAWAPRYKFPLAKVKCPTCQKQLNSAQLSSVSAQYHIEFSDAASSLKKTNGDKLICVYWKQTYPGHWFAFLSTGPQPVPGSEDLRAFLSLPWNLHDSTSDQETHFTAVEAHQGTHDHGIRRTSHGPRHPEAAGFRGKNGF